MSTPKRIGTKVFSYTILIVGAGFALAPLIYMFSLSLQSDADIFASTPVFIPSVWHIQNYLEIWGKAPFLRFFFNSTIVAVCVTGSHLFFDPLTGYVFAKYRFPLKDVLFLLIMGTLMIPFFVRMIPLYVMMSQWNWLNTYPALIAPFMMSAYGIFLMRQFIQPLPYELIDAARIDGCSEFGIYWHIILPQVKPAIATLGLFTFLASWDELLWPLIIVNTTEMRTMPLGLTMFSQEYYTQWQYTATGAVILFVPSLILFLFTQRYFIRSLSLTGFK